MQNTNENLYSEKNFQLLINSLKSIKKKHHNKKTQQMTINKKYMTH